MSENLVTLSTADKGRIRETLRRKRLDHFADPLSALLSTFPDIAEVSISSANIMVSMRGGVCTFTGGQALSFDDKPPGVFDTRATRTEDDLKRSNRSHP
jgi:hypothetical protein